MERVTIGQITAAYGIRGEVRVFPLTDVPDRFEGLARVSLSRRRSEKEDEVVIESACLEWVRYSGRVVIAKFEGVDDREGAEGLRQLYLQVPRAEAAQLPEGSYYIFDIVGLKVVTVDGEELGRVVEVFSTGSNDVYVVERPSNSQVLIPAIRDVVRQIDLGSGLIIISPIPGLLE